MIEIIYDITMLGIGTFDIKNRTGIFRVVDNTTKALVKRKDCKLLFYASDLVEECNQYLSSDSIYKGYYIGNKREERLKKLQKQLREKEKTLSFRIDNNNDIRNYYRKFVRIGLYTTRLKLLPKLIKHEHNKFDSKASIYHSPFLPIPEEFQQKNTFKRFLTVYDLIPIIYPDYFKSLETPVERAINSMTKDDFFFSISHSTKNDLCNYRKDIDPDKVFVTHLAADPIVFRRINEATYINSILKKYNIPTDTPYFLGLSTLEPRKNIHQVIRSFARLIQEQNIKDLNLVLVGKKGWDFEKIFEELNIFSSIRSRVIFTGFADDQDLAALYSGAMSFVYVSHYEGFGLPPLEAMQCGIPTITSNNSSLPEVVGDAAIMVNSRDEDALCQAMWQVYSNDSIRSEFSSKALKQAGKFSWDRCVEETIKGYQAALSM